jgi:hypothetical protein
MHENNGSMAQYDRQIFRDGEEKNQHKEAMSDN